MVAKIVMVKKYTESLVKNNRDIYFVFGDNLIGKGKGGQAIIRDEPNTIGVPTKKLPNNHSKSFFNDEEFESNKKAINKAFKKILKKLNDGFFIALPTNGLGTGLSRLPEKAPLTNDYLKKLINKLKEKYNVIE
jgi:hypothetical protein